MRDSSNDMTTRSFRGSHGLRIFAGVVVPLLWLSSGCSALGDGPTPTEEAGAPAEYRGVVSLEEAYDAFASITGATRNRIQQQDMPSITVVDDVWMTATMVLPGSVAEGFEGEGFIIEVLRYPFAGSDEYFSWPPIGYSSQVSCPGYVYGLRNAGAGFDDSARSVRALDPYGVSNLLALDRLSPDLWIGEVVAQRGSSDDAVYPADAWVVWENNLLAVSSGEGAVRRLQFDDSGALVALTDFLLEPEVKPDFLANFISDPDSSRLEGYIPDNAVKLRFSYEPVGNIIVGAEDRDTNWWASVGLRSWDTEMSPQFLDAIEEENLISQASELGLEFVFSDWRAVRVPDGELFGIALFKNPEAPGEPYTIVTFDYEGNSPAIDSTGQEVICTTSYELLPPPAIDSGQEQEAEEEFFTD